MQSNAKMDHPKVHNFQNLEARVFGRLTVLHYVGNASWLTRCECGNEKIVPTKQLLRSQTQSCGCLMIDRTKEANTRHGKNGTRVYRIWSGMLTRCRNVNSKDYPRYGGRGITVCDRWLSFEAFYSDMGEPTDTQTIERKENDGNYEPGNCVWIESELQASNRRSTVHVVHNGERMTAAQCDRELGIRVGTTARRIKKGLVAETAPTVFLR